MIEIDFRLLAQNCAESKKNRMKCDTVVFHFNSLLWYNISVAVGRYHDSIYGYAYFCYNKVVMD